MSKLKYFLPPALCCALLILGDQWVKHWARTVLYPVATLPVIPGFFQFTYLENTGAAFGLFEGARWVFIPLTVLVFIVILIYYARLPLTRESWKQRVPLVLVFAGAAGNFIDRVANGYVTDMFEFTFVTFPVFNIADVCLVLGTFSLATIILLFIKETD
ncbi:MAG: signal peptidase II [Clostridiales bacterium]|jgi:signal peptidase II|nr:signal peptidase II [Clostridiales bacterium]